MQDNRDGNGLASQLTDSQVYRRAVDYEALERIGRDLLDALGVEATPGTADTPRRFASFWQEFIEYDSGVLDTTFESVRTDQMVVVSGVRVWSVCEHHLLPFYADISMGYIAQERVLGLSKFARIAQLHAHRPQIQERLVDDIAADISRLSGSEDVAVVASGVHLCMVMRGIKTSGVMTSSVLRGAFYDDSRTRQEFFSHLPAPDRTP